MGDLDDRSWLWLCYTYSPIYAYCYILMLKEGEHVK